MKLKLLIGFIASLIPTLVHADLLLRYENGIEAFMANFSAFYISRVPELEGNMTPIEWEDIDREIGRCVLAAYEAELGADAAEDFVAEVEALARVDITSNRVMNEAMAPIMTNAAANRAVAVCGQNERTAEQLANSRMIEIISDPKNLALLNAE